MYQQTKVSFVIGRGKENYPKRLFFGVSGRRVISDCK